MYDTSNNMQLNVQNTDNQSTTSSNITTPNSIRSSFSNESSASSRSTSSTPNRSSMKSSPKSKPSLEIKNDRRSSLSTVRFAEPEPEPKVERRHTNYSRPSPVSSPVPQSHSRPPLASSNRASSRSSAGPQPYSTYGVQTPQTGQIQYRKLRSSQRYSAPVQPLQLSPRRSMARISQEFTSPSLALERRVSSFQSVTSTTSTRSAPATLQSLPSTSSPGQYNPLEHYIPCLHASCTTHFLSTSTGPAHHLASGPYSLRAHHAYCPVHAAAELKEANAYCKRNYERLRQNAGRKTLGEIDAEFDGFLEMYRADRKVEDADLKRRLRLLILGMSSSKTTDKKGKQAADATWDWKYTPRYCTRADCVSEPYSPFASHLYAFYTTPRQSTFVPLSTCCPTCATTEVEAFEQMFAVKWGSRCGWEDREWAEWFRGQVGEREVEKGFWEGAQERVSREKGPGVWMDGREGEGENNVVVRRKSVFKRLFRVGGKTE